MAVTHCTRLLQHFFVCQGLLEERLYNLALDSLITLDLSVTNCRNTDGRIFLYAPFS